ncbi:hypothetical protein [Nocardioides pantholopis]|uniref:hypothetical protein n=1 Tax=Nocardioides pantholopis TaxID=2483798 RepID=UPI000FD851E4|nr:hypothetical protein [Nocardioides pantholopis]
MTYLNWTQFEFNDVWHQLGKCGPSGHYLLPDDRRALTEAKEDRSAPDEEIFRLVAAVRGRSRKFYPSDDDFCELIEYLADEDPARLDNFAADATSTGYLVRVGIENTPKAFALLGKHHPQQVATGLMYHWGDALAEYDQHPARFTQWRDANPGDLPTPLDIAAAVADGVAAGTADAQTREQRRGGRHTSPQDARVRIVAEFTALISPTVRRLPNQRDGVKSRLRETIQAHPDAWDVVVPWVLQVAGESHLPTQATGWTMTTDIQPTFDPIPAVKGVVAADIQPAADRARALLSILEGDDDNATAIARLSQEADHQRRERFPRPLALPTSTWLSDLHVEETLRDCVRTACTMFADDFAPGPASEEEGHVGSLMTRLITEINAVRTHHALTNQPVPVEMTGRYRVIPKGEENTVNADLALVIHIDAPGALRGSHADFVQVKKAKLKKKASSAEKWKIETRQLSWLLATSPTAVYWLIENTGLIRVVPAKVLLAIADGTARLANGTFTIDYCDVRHAAIDLHSYLVDLVTGGWLGSSNDDTIALATGTTGTTGARTLFELTIRRELAADDR